MYNQNSLLIITILFITLVIAIEMGYRIGRKYDPRSNKEAKSHIQAIQTSLLGILALLLGFTFSLSLQRYDNRNVAVVDESVAIGAAYLRSQLLPDSVRDDAQQLFRDYIDVRVAETTVSLADPKDRLVLLTQATEKQQALWHYAMTALDEDDRPATTGLFIQSLNDLINSYENRNAALDRHIPEIVLFLLYGTFIMTWGIVGYASGVTGHRTSFVAYIMLLLIVLLVFVIIDLDRPRRGLIEINHTSLYDMQALIHADQGEGVQD